MRNCESKMAVHTHTHTHTTLINDVVISCAQITKQRQGGYTY